MAGATGWLEQQGGWSNRVAGPWNLLKWVLCWYADDFWEEVPGSYDSRVEHHV